MHVFEITCTHCGQQLGFSEEDDLDVSCTGCASVSECENCDEYFDEEDVVEMPCGDTVCRRCLENMLNPARALEAIMNAVEEAELPDVEFTRRSADGASVVATVLGRSFTITVDDA